MKIILTVISLIAFQCAALSQTNTVNAKSVTTGKSNQIKTFYVFSDESDNTNTNFTPTAQNKNILITTIPNSTLPLNTLPIVLDVTGVITFKKHESLKIPSNHEVFIEDKLTGKVFNLTNAQTYKFYVEQHVPNRFVMHVLNKTNYNESVTVN